MCHKVSSYIYSGKLAYHYELRLAEAKSFSTIGLRFVTKIFKHARTSCEESKARASAMASSKASRVPEPIEKWPVRSASPIRTLLPTIQISLRSSGKLRHTDLFDSSAWPPRSGANTRSQ